MVRGRDTARSPPTRTSRAQGANAVAGNLYITEADLAAVDVKNGGAYVVAQTTSGVNGAKALQAAADRAVAEKRRLFGFYGSGANTCPTARPTAATTRLKGIKGTLESYSKADLDENPTLADMTRAALTVMAAEKGRPFALFVEAGDGRLRAARQQPRQRDRRRPERRGGRARDHRLGGEEQQLGRVGADRDGRPRPLPRHRRPQGARRPAAPSLTRPAPAR